MTGTDMQIFLENSILHDRMEIKEIGQTIKNHLDVGNFTLSDVLEHSDMEELDYYIHISFDDLALDIEVFLLPTRAEGVYYITEIGSYW